MIRIGLGAMPSVFPRATRIMAVALALGFVGVARADLPGTLPLSAAGDGHLWWVVKVAPEEESSSGPARGAATGPGEIGWALMHHASDSPAPTERLVTRLADEPAAIAAGDQRVVLVSRGEREGSYFIVTMFAAKNEAVGHWYTLPRGAPMVLDAPPVEGDIRSVALAGDVLGLLLRVRRDDPAAPVRYWFGTIPCESGADATWTERPLPPLAMSESVRLFAREQEFAAVGMADGDRAGTDARARLAVLSDGSWSAQDIVRPAEPLDARAVLGAFALEGRPALVERAGTRVRVGFIRTGLIDTGLAGGGVSAGMDTATAAGSTASSQKGSMQPASIQPWADFDEPVRPWSLGPFHPPGSTMRAALLELADRGRGVVRVLPLSASAPEPVVQLSPPGFASGGWIHLPIVGVLSVALVLGAMIFGSDAYLESRLAAAGAETDTAPRRVRRARGARLGRRAFAMLVDLLPGLVAVWFVVRGSPFELLQIPAFQTNLAAAVPSLIVFASGWAFASMGDVLFGRSLGKRVAGLRIIAARGGRPTAWRRLARALASLVVVANPVVMLLVLLHPRGDGPADMLSGTAVVDAEEADADDALAASDGERDPGS
jgi:uncharacterized RDD family membrane protein YckC